MAVLPRNGEVVEDDMVGLEANLNSLCGSRGQAVVREVQHRKCTV